MQPDTFPFFEIKEVGGEDGTFTGIASQYGLEDLGGDVIDKGAFTKTLADSASVPVLWQHDAQEVIGQGTVKEWQGKLILTAQLDLEDPTAQKAYGKLKRKLITGLSIGYTAIKSIWEEINEADVRKWVRHITELKLWEVSVVTFPMLPAAQVTRVKTARDSGEFLQLSRAWLQAEQKSPTADAARRADLRFVLEKGLALLADPGCSPAIGSSGLITTIDKAMEVLRGAA
jgi:HK97 family phage prohead protease